MHDQSDEATQASSTRKATLRPDRPRRRRTYRETPEYADFACRMVAAFGKRVADGDPDELLLLTQLAEAVKAATAAAVAGLREQGHSDQVIAAELGCTRQAVEQRWPRGR